MRMRCEQANFAPNMSDSKSSRRSVDFDLHGIVTVRLVDATTADIEAVRRQLGLAPISPSATPDLTIRFVPDLATENMALLDLEASGFTADGFFLLRSSKRPAKVKLPLERLGEPCEIVAQSGLRSVPLLANVVGLRFLRKGYVPLHASAFRYAGCDVLVAGWSKGGKTEALLAFAAHGARYVGDEYLMLSADGARVYGIPEAIRTWDWQIKQVASLRKQLSTGRRILFASIRCLDLLQASCGLRRLQEALPPLKRQLNVTFAPQRIFADRTGPFSAGVDKVFLMVTHQKTSIEVERVTADLVARRMAASAAFELGRLMARYQEYRYAFPDRRNELLEDASARLSEMLLSALRGKEAYEVRHPHPMSLRKLYEAMRPFVEGTPESQGLAVSA
jgi:hypothetical protein